MRAALERQPGKGSPYEAALQQRLDEFTTKLESGVTRRRPARRNDPGGKRSVDPRSPCGRAPPPCYEGDPPLADRLKELVPVERGESTEDPHEDLSPIRGISASRGH